VKGERECGGGSRLNSELPIVDQVKVGGLPARD
jgi:hypothetical protein